MIIDKLDGRRRAVIEHVMPQVYQGRFPIKRVVGDNIVVAADVFTDGHDHLAAVILHRHEHDHDWQEAPMTPRGNDRWQGSFSIRQTGTYYYTIMAWVDRFASWRDELNRREQPEDIAAALLIGAELVDQAAHWAHGAAKNQFRRWSSTLCNDTTPLADRTTLALSTELADGMAHYQDRSLATQYDRELRVTVDRERARFSAWYELFPRSCLPEADEHGTFKECSKRLTDIAAAGFDIVYLPPIHPIGHTHRKGRNNALHAEPGDPGSPWAIGNEQGGHKAVHPDLGTLDDFREFVTRAKQLGMEVALDIALQCSPDHPYVKDHPQWFLWRPDGTIQYAENPPKKYQDIYPLNFETDDWVALWEELKSVFTFWIEQGVQAFRVDNPHTKPFVFWEWLIGEIKRDYPDVLFLAEAFARPKLMYRLAKVGFSQSYTYFTWRITKWELTQYLTELSQSDVREFFRPNFWPNTPDILHVYLQFGGRPAFMTRLVLAATLAANYGIYGPAYELCQRESREYGSEEYLNSEKYEIRHWQMNAPESLQDFVARINRIRREHPALQQDWNLEFYPVDNEQIICFGKWRSERASEPVASDLKNDDLTKNARSVNVRSDVIIVLVNLDPYHRQAGWVDLPLGKLGIDPRRPYQMHDLLSGARYLWNGGHNYAEFDPQGHQAHIFHLLPRLRTEQDFDYFF